jgi:large subunit ribosomal protein L31
MRENIHPTYYPDAQIICACGNTWTTGSTVKVIHTDVCSKCHPFFTGEQRIVDTEGQVDRFYKKLQARKSYLDGVRLRIRPHFTRRTIIEAGLGNRPTEALAKAEIQCRTGAGEAGSGRSRPAGSGWFWRKSLADLKKKLRQLGYELPGSRRNRRLSLATYQSAISNRQTPGVCLFISIR